MDDYFQLVTNRYKKLRDIHLRILNTKIIKPASNNLSIKYRNYVDNQTITSGLTDALCVELDMVLLEEFGINKIENHPKAWERIQNIINDTSIHITYNDFIKIEYGVLRRAMFYQKRNSNYYVVHSLFEKYIRLNSLELYWLR